MTQQTGVSRFGSRGEIANLEPRLLAPNNGMHPAHIVLFEWRIGEAEFEYWSSVHVNAGLHTTHWAAWSNTYLNRGEIKLLSRLFIGLSLIAVVLFAAGAASPSPYQVAYQKAQIMVQHSLRVENIAWQTRNRQLYETLIDDEINRRWSAQWREYWKVDDALQPFKAHLIDVQPQENLIVTTVRVAQGEGEWWQVRPYQEKRYYRPTEEGWTRTVPDSAYWGIRKHLETGHLRLVYHNQDSAVIQKTAPTLEQAYVELHEILGLPEPPADEKFEIMIRPDIVGRWGWTENGLEVTSPALAKVPDGLTESAYLADYVLYRLTYRAVRDASPRPTNQFVYRWAVMVWGIRGWLRTNLLDEVTPAHAQTQQVFQDYGREHFPFDLNDVIDMNMSAAGNRQQVVWRLYAAESIIDYMVVIYGEEMFPDLLNGLTEYGSWEQLIPDLFDDSAKEFAAGWNAYLAEKYEIESQ